MFEDARLMSSALCFCQWEFRRCKCSCHMVIPEIGAQWKRHSVMPSTVQFIPKVHRRPQHFVIVVYCFSCAVAMKTFPLLIWQIVPTGAKHTHPSGSQGSHLEQHLCGEAQSWHTDPQRWSCPPWPQLLTSSMGRPSDSQGFRVRKK